MPMPNALPRMLKYACLMAAATSTIGLVLAELSMDPHGPNLMWLIWPLIFAAQLALFHSYLRKDADTPYATTALLALLSAALAFSAIHLALEPAAVGMAVIHLIISLVAGALAHRMRMRPARASPHAGASNPGHAPSSPNRLDADRLRKLKALHDSGAITDEQFEREKSRAFGH